MSHKELQESRTMSWNRWSLDKILGQTIPQCIGKYSKKKPSCQGCDMKTRCREESR